MAASKPTIQTRFVEEILYKIVDTMTLAYLVARPGQAIGRNTTPIS